MVVVLVHVAVVQLVTMNPAVCAGDVAVTVSPLVPPYLRSMMMLVSPALTATDLIRFVHVFRHKRAALTMPEHLPVIEAMTPAHRPLGHMGGRHMIRGPMPRAVHPMSHLMVAVVHPDARACMRMRMPAGTHIDPPMPGGSRWHWRKWRRCLWTCLHVGSRRGLLRRSRLRRRQGLVGCRPLRS